jgi:hypothetical protein
MTTDTPPPFKPQEVDDILMAFPAGAAFRSLMPGMDQIPEDFHRDRGDARPWVEFQRRWFYDGIAAGKVAITAKPGIDKTLALRHLTAIQKSFEPRHEHKEAAVAYLASQWLNIEEGGSSA